MRADTGVPQAGKTPHSYLSRDCTHLPAQQIHGHGHTSVSNSQNASPLPKSFCCLDKQAGKIWEQKEWRWEQDTPSPLYSTRSAGGSIPSPPPHLALAAQTPLLQSGPDALNPTRMLWVVAVVTTGALVFEHHRVINQSCNNIQEELSSSNRTGCPGLSAANPNAAPFQGWV